MPKIIGPKKFGIVVMAALLSTPVVSQAHGIAKREANESGRALRQAATAMDSVVLGADRIS